MKKLDNNLRDKLASYESDYSSMVLDHVLAAVNEKEKDRKYLIWLWLGLALLVLSSAYLFIDKTYKSKAAQKQFIPNTATVAKPVLIEQAKTSINNSKLPEQSALKLIASKDLNPEESEVIENNSPELVIKDIEAFSQTERDIDLTRNDEFDIISSKDEAIYKQEEEKVKIESKESYTPLPILSISTLNQQLFELESLNNRILDEPIGCPSFSGKLRSPIFVETYISHDLPFRQLADNSAESQISYITRRDDSESPTYSYHAGVRASSNVVSKIVLRLGIDYAQITEKFKVTNLETTREVVIRDAEGNIISTSIEQGFRDVVKYNKIKSFNIPISLGWQNYFGKVGVSIHGGVAFNLMSSHNGIIFEPGPTSMPRIVSSGTDGELSAFKTDIGLSAIGSIGLAYPINEKIDFLVEPNVKYILNPINQSAYPVEQRMFTAGLLTGLRYKF